MDQKTIRVDVDGVLCTNTDGQYARAVPLRGNIDKINAAYDEGHLIVIWTARGTTTGIDWRALTEGQLKRWGVRYHALEMGKPHYDILIDDKAVSSP